MVHASTIDSECGYNSCLESEAIISVTLVILGHALLQLGYSLSIRCGG